MSAPTSEKPLRLHRHRRWAFEQLLVESMLMLLAVAVVTLFIRTGPIDYQYVDRAALAIWALIVLPLFGYRLRLGLRGYTEFSSTSRQRPDQAAQMIVWSYANGIKVTWGLTGRRVQITERIGWGAPVDLYAPRAGWLPDRRFNREVAELRQRASEHGADIEPTGSRWRELAIGLVLVGIILATSTRAAAVGVVWPWTAIASHTVEACPALDAAGLERYWPENTRWGIHEQDTYSLRGDDDCEWEREFSPDGVAPFKMLALSVRHYESDTEQSAVTAANNEFDEEQRDSDYPSIRVSGYGDEAFFVSTPTLVLLAARKANVTVTLSVRPDKLNGDGEAAVKGLAAEIIDTIELDSTEAAEREST